VARYDSRVLLHDSEVERMKETKYYHLKIKRKDGGIENYSIKDETIIVRSYSE